MKSTFPEKTGGGEFGNEPIFMAIHADAPEMQVAYNRAFETISVFIHHIDQQPNALRSAKLRFRDPDESERLGKDRFLYLWLTNVYHYSEENFFSGVFFEVPAEFQKWHQVGERLIFTSDSLFDWMILEDGHLHGGFTLRIARDILPESKRTDYDQHIGVSVYEPLPL